MSPRTETVTTISVKDFPEYLPRLRTIAACLAQGTGMDCAEAAETTGALTTACKNVLKHTPGSNQDDGLFITVKRSRSRLAMNVTTRSAGARKGKGLGTRLIRAVIDGVRFLSGRAGYRITLIRQAKKRKALRRKLREMAESAHRY